MNPQGLEPSEVWTREYVRTELWSNVYGEPLPPDAEPEPGSVPLETCPLTVWLAGACREVLDVGCGWMWYAAPEWLDVTGADISPPMLELGKSLHPDREFVHTSSFDLPFADDEFCGVRSSGMLRHIEDWRSPLTEMVRVAGKRLAFTLLTAEEPEKCGPYQWCTTREEVHDALPTTATVEAETHKPKDHRTFESTRFMVRL